MASMRDAVGLHRFLKHAKTTFETPYKVGETVGLAHLASCSVVSLVTEP